MGTAILQSLMTKKKKSLLNKRLLKMMDQDDLSHDFGVTGLTGNTGSGNYEYSHGFGTTGQVVTVDGDEMVFTVKITTEASEERMIKDVDVGGTTLILET